MEMEFDIEGDIDACSLPNLLYTACATRETGVLRLNRGDSEKLVYIRDGNIIFAGSNDRDDRLGQVLLRAAKVDLESLTSATERSIKDGKRLGTVLVENGWLQPQDLVWGVIAQVEEILFSVFEWTSGSYQLRLGDLPTREVITLNVNSADILMRGIRRVDSWYRIQEAIGTLDTVFRQAPGVALSAFKITLSEEELSLLASLDRPSSLREICRFSPIPDFEVGRILWGFLVTGLIVRTNP
jgi:hypothetical protein